MYFEFVDVAVNLLLQAIVSHDLQVALCRDRHLKEIYESCAKTFTILSSIYLEREGSSWLFEYVSRSNFKDILKLVCMLEDEMTIGMVIGDKSGDGSGGLHGGYYKYYYFYEQFLRG